MFFLEAVYLYGFEYTGIHGQIGKKVSFFLEAKCVLTINKSLKKSWEFQIQNHFSSSMLPYAQLRSQEGAGSKVLNFIFVSSILVPFRNTSFKIVSNSIA